MKRDAATPPADADAASVDAKLQPFEEAMRERFPSREALLAEAREQTQRAVGKRTRRLVVGSTALAALIASVVVVDPALSTSEYHAGIGQRLEVVLDGGDRVTMDSASVLRAGLHLRSRRLTLVRGEVLVSAARHWRPLAVQAAGARIVDTGTVFSVRLDAGPADAAAPAGQVLGLRVSVLEGSVDVSAEAGAASRGAPMTVRAGEALYLVRAPDAAGGRAVNPAGWPRGTPAPLDVDRALAWRRGKLMFDGTPLAQAVTEMQRYRAAPIRLLDARSAGMRLSGEFDIDGVEAVLDDLALTLPVRVSRAADGSVAITAR